MLEVLAIQAALLSELVEADPNCSTLTDYAWRVPEVGLS